MTPLFDAMDGETLQQKTTCKKNSQLQDPWCQEGGGKHIQDLSEHVPGTTWHHEAKAKGCERHCVYMCGVTEHAEDTPGWSRQGTNPRK